MSDAQESHVRPGVESGEHLVDLENLSTLRVDALAAWEDVEQQDFRLGQLGTKLFDDRSHAIDHLLGAVAAVARVVRSDHDDSNLGVDIFNVAVVEPPQDMLCSIATDAKVHGVALDVILLPDRLALAFPAVRDRVADKDQIDVALCHALVE